MIARGIRPWKKVLSYVTPLGSKAKSFNPLLTSPSLLGEGWWHQIIAFILFPLHMADMLGLDKSSILEAKFEFSGFGHHVWIPGWIPHHFNFA